MGLGSSSNKIFLSVADGKIIQRVKEGTARAEQRTTKSGSVVWELKHGHIEGILTGIKVREANVGGADIKSFVFDIEDGEYNFSLEIMYDSRYATSLIFALCNPEVNFAKPIRITPWQKVVDGKKKTACYLSQGEKDIKWYFSKETPHGMPELEKKVFKGKEVWDSWERMQFLEQYLKTKVVPKLTGVAYADEQFTNTNQQINQHDQGGYVPDLNTFPEDDDDLPF